MPWSSGDSLSPSILNIRAGEAALVTGFSTNTLQGQSGTTVNVISDLSAQQTLAAQRAELGGVPSTKSGVLSLKAHSQQTDYIHFQDSAALKSNFLLGLRTGDSSASLVDGLNLYDESANTMIVRFSSDSVRFYPPIVAPIFDTGGALASTYNAALFLRGASKESQIQSAINAAAADGVSRVYVPASMYPYSTLSMSFDSRVQMVREGGDWSAYDVLAYGVPANDNVDRTFDLQSVESARPADVRVHFPPGTYTLSQSGGSNLFRIIKSGVYDFRGAYLKYGGAGNLSTGSDGGGLGIVNVLTDNVELWGNIHCNNKARYGIARKGDSTRLGFFGSILSTLTAGGVWSGIWQRASADVAGAGNYAGHLPAKALYGWLSRPQCPIVDTSDSITSVQDVTAALLGGDATTGENTGVAIVMGNAYNVCAARLDKLGVMSSMKIQEDNDHWLDLLCHDVGCNTFELHGSTPSTITNGYPPGTVWGQFIKSGANSGWFHYNVFSGQTLLPNVNITGGSTVNSGLVDVRGVVRGQDGTQLAPTYSYLSDTSMGFYKSATSSVALSAYTFRMGTPDRSEYLSLAQTGSGNWRLGKIGTNTGAFTLSTDSGTMAVGAGVGASLVLQTGGGVTRVTVDSTGSVSLGQNRLLSVRTQASLDSTSLAVNEMAFQIVAGSVATLAIRSGGTIYYFASSASTKG